MIYSVKESFQNFQTMSICTLLEFKARLGSLFYLLLMLAIHLIILISNLKINTRSIDSIVTILFFQHRKLILFYQ